MLYAYIDYISFDLSLYNQYLSNVITLIADSCNTSKKMAKERKIQFVGCFSHRYNLAMDHFLEHKNNQISKVDELVKKLN